MGHEQLKLENQLCFPVYATSRLITREYQPMLDELGITYPQYLVLLTLWEQDKMPVNDIAKKLILKTNTITPLLKRMEVLGLVKREKDEVDTRKVLVFLTEKSKEMETKAAEIPSKIFNQLLKGNVDVDKLMELKNQLGDIIALLKRVDD
ncbi:MarR family winged helix-turn-helix transcriptional regulator [Flammeovirga kamogawensis]|uniref:HTH-type transcriptional regulator SarZ n=1 Tax=Flammeovirga kamogawensis TaxID=373891 RepID=A0ABX8H572_9BACT|nr:MarR family transcriptional regulator [Flammeovirga kamogawensis]MBB6463530.1 DNA-binding MarR family transcriptional regulator [Flammeovirga kamogawensis]QWG10587.1 MarR family transcriptional regulator [Flammeovirga kamogawensis]TRX63693.1 MarR family transcriptional regulator [Flammeovirga kamogawensis]